MNIPESVHELTDQLLEAAFYYEGVSASVRQGNHEHTKRAIGTVLLDDWETEDRATAHALHAATGFACTPSTEQVLKGRPHDQGVAQEVAENMADLAAHILQTPELYETGIERRGNKNALTGLVTEIAILATLWKGIAHGHREEKYYALPATYDQDVSGIIDGYHTGVDIILRKSGEPKKKGFIQAKTSSNYLQFNPGRKIYRPGIAVMTPALLLEDPQARGHDLLEVVASDDIPMIWRANRNADTLLAQAAIQKRLFRKLNLQTTT